MLPSASIRQADGKKRLTTMEDLSGWVSEERKPVQGQRRTHSSSVFESKLTPYSCSTASVVPSMGPVNGGSRQRPHHRCRVKSELTASESQPG